jgi:hypothetical protein
MIGLRDLIREISPPWLRREWGEKFTYAHGLALDGVLEWAIQGVKARFPSKAPEEALPLMGKDRGIIRGFQEPASSYRVRLARWMTDRRRAGNAFALLEQVRAYFYGHSLTLRTVNDRGSWQTIAQSGAYSVDRLMGNWNWDGRFPLLARTRWWLILNNVSTVWQSSGVFGDGLTTLGDGSVIGFTATPDQIASLRQLVSSHPGGWKPGGTACPFIIVEFDQVFDPSDSPPGVANGQWKRFGREDGGVYRPARHPECRYVSGKVRQFAP